ncbi:cryptochrome/photolyase family protein [Seohaeicola zhoushanensis]|uniref:Deoxyribodipyrimidine photo-lyase n=1 Tax=Seohaeicola zhoushanensis TaxID=1569283 RepID=A0A8J3M9I4_9RHOB|nr:deoxyribodipyrimidine photo-lyase [Seohaeicola zhoushanensis]GHF68011.1 deoxyribodipyrimidine photo-lyase [Seohaeicola zhoushanensis]
MADNRPIILWFRRDLRLADHAALTAAFESGRPVIPVFVLDEVAEALGAAPKWRLGKGLEVFAQALERRGSRLVLRRGKALEVLRALVQETGAGAVWWSRLYDPACVERDTAVKAALKDEGVDARSFAGHLLFEPWTVETGQGGYYKVYTPFWKAVQGRDPGQPRAAPGRIAGPQDWPASDRLEDWALGAAMLRGGEIVARHTNAGEAAAQERLDAFIEQGIDRYGERRDMPGCDGTSRLSEYLALGEISPHRAWAAGQRAVEEGKAGAVTFLKELVWREFAYHLMHHTPHMLTDNWRSEWDAFPWQEDQRRSEVIAWKHARTGVPFVDAGLREMYVTGRMHNRARMVVASYLTKHLMVHWKVGLKWFEDCLTDWDPASNAMGWQWVAGSGPDAAPYFRVFNPVTQLEKFDPRGLYARAWIAEGQSMPPATALEYFDAVPRSWRLSPEAAYPAPVVGLAEGRDRALAAYGARESAQ